MSNTKEIIEFKTSDGLMLPGILYSPKKHVNKVAIYLHGNGSSSVFYDESEKQHLPSELNKIGVALLKFNNRGAHIIKKLNVNLGKLTERKKFGCAYEIIKECVYDIEGAVNFLKGLGYNEYYLIGASTGANKICVYNHYKPKNQFKKYVLLCGGDDTGIYFKMLGRKDFFDILSRSKEKIKNGEGEDLVRSLLPDEIISYKAFYDIANPDGDYNCFPFLEVIDKSVKLSSMPKFSYFEEVKKESLVVYGSKDEYVWGDANRIIGVLKTLKPEFKYKVIEDADHRFTGKDSELAKLVASWLQNK